MLSDGVNKMWLLRINRGLDIFGAENHVELLDHLIRREMIEDDSDKNKARVLAAVEHALKHMDDEPSEDEDDLDE